MYMRVYSYCFHFHNDTGTLHGHCQAEKDMVVVWVDAHADINPPLSSPSGNSYMQQTPAQYTCLRIA